MPLVVLLALATPAPAADSPPPPLLHLRVADHTVAITSQPGGGASIGGDVTMSEMGGVDVSSDLDDWVDDCDRGGACVADVVLHFEDGRTLTAYGATPYEWDGRRLVLDAEELER